MVHPGGGRTRARSRDRELVIDALSAAFADDQLTEQEHERRVATALAATRLDELRPLLADLQLPDGHAAVALVRPARDGERESSRRPRALWLAAGAAATLGGLAVIGAVADSRDGDGSEAGVRPLTAEGYEDFVDAYREEFGTTEAVSAELMPEYVAVRVPLEDDRFRYYYWDRDGFSANTGGTLAPGFTTVDLAAVDAAALADNQQVALEDLDVEEPQVDRVVIDDDYDEVGFRALGDLGPRAPVPPHVRIHVGNEFSEQGTLATDLAGEQILFESPWEPATAG